MRVLVVHEVDFVHKVVYEWHEFPEMLARAGHEVAVLDYDNNSGWSDIREWGLGPKRTVAAGRLDPTTRLDLYRMIGPPNRELRRLYAAAAAAKVVRRVFAEHKPDVVLLYAVPTCGPAIVRVARQAGVPVVFRSFDILSHLVPRAIGLAVDILERHVYRRCDAVLASNPHLAGYVRRITRDRASVHLLYLPVDTDRFSSQRDHRTSTLSALGIDPDSRVAVFVGTLFDFSGLGSVIESWGRVLTAEPRAHLLIVGGGPDESRLRDLAANTPHASAITFTGMRAYDEIPTLISAGDVGICPFDILPVTRDINPTKVLQYLACGVPCLCTPLDGTMAVLPAEESGVRYAQPGDEFVNALGTLLADPRLSTGMGAAGRDWVVANHSFPQVTSGLVRELNEAIRVKRGPGATEEATVGE